MEALRDYKRLAAPMSEHYYVARFGEVIDGASDTRLDAALLQNTSSLAGAGQQHASAGDRAPNDRGIVVGPAAIPMWSWIAAGLGATAALAATGDVASALVGGGLWFAAAQAVAWMLRRARQRMR